MLVNKSSLDNSIYCQIHKSDIMGWYMGNFQRDQLYLMWHAGKLFSHVKPKIHPYSIASIWEISESSR